MRDEYINFHETHLIDVALRHEIERLQLNLKEYSGQEWFNDEERYQEMIGELKAIRNKLTRAFYMEVYNMK